MKLRPTAVLLALSCSLAVTASSQAQETQDPILFTADSLSFDEPNGIVTATGDVELVEGARILRAGGVTYNMRSGIVAASGDVVLLEADGTVLFADYMELTDDLRDGFVRNIGILLSDDSRLAAAEGGRRDGSQTELHQAVYSPCKPCEDDPDRPLLWQIKASRVVHDQEAQTVTYHNARLEMFGVPVLYTPYFTHADPTVERKSGFLAPSVGQSPDLGLFLRGSYYWDVAPDRDLTLTTTASTEKTPLVEAAWRQRLENGHVLASAGLTEGEALDDDGELSERLRGYLDVRARFSQEPPWTWGVDVDVVTDPTLLPMYQIDTSDVLTSRVFAEGLFEREYAYATVLSFQDLRPALRDTEPLFVPYAEYSALGAPHALLGGRWQFDTNFYAVERESGQDTRRLAFDANWTRDWVHATGLVTTATFSTQGSAYWTENGTGPGGEDTGALLFPRAQLLARLPLVRESGTIQQVLEPTLALTAAPSIDQTDQPNEDSRDFEFDDTSLFALDRYPGFDRVEGGVRLTYGVRWGVFGSQGGSSSLFLGQEFRLAGLGNYDEDSGLSDPNSDIVGRIELAPGPYLDLDYRFRLDPDSFDVRRSDLTLSAGTDRFRAQATYAYIANPPSDTASVSRENLNLGFMARLSEHWRVTSSTAYDLGHDIGPLSTTVSFIYQDECFDFSASATRSYLERQGLENGDTFMFRLGFKNLGSVETSSLTGL